MTYKYIDKTSETGFVKAALPLIAFAVSLIPNNNYIIPQQTPVNYGDYAEQNTNSVISSISYADENEKAEALFSFASRLVENIEDLDADIAQIISDDFWEMYG